PVEVERAPEERRQGGAVDGDGHVQPLGLGPEVGEPHVAQQRVLSYRAADLDGDHVQPAHRALHLRDGPLDVLERHEADALEPLRAHRAAVVEPVVVRAGPCRRETPVERDGERELVGGMDDPHVELILVTVRGASPRIVGPHPAIVDGLALRRGQVAVDADEPDVRLGAPNFTVHESDDIAAARLRVARTPLAILRVDPLVRRVDLDHVAVAIEHELGLVSQGTLLGSGDASRKSRPRSQSLRTYHRKVASRRWAPMSISSVSRPDTRAGHGMLRGQKSPSRRAWPRVCRAVFREGDYVWIRHVDLFLL